MTVQKKPNLRPFQWWMTTDEESYHNPVDTREEAFEIAQAEGYSTIAECQKGDFDLRIKADWVIETLVGQNEERVNEDGDFLKFSREQEDDLSEMLTAAMYAWVEKHKINIEAWMFEEIQNVEKVPAPANPEPAP